MSVERDEIDERLDYLFDSLKIEFNIVHGRYKVWQMLKDTPRDQWTDLHYEAFTRISNRPSRLDVIIQT